MSRYIDADALIAKMPTVMDMQDTYLPIHFKEWLIDTAPSIDIEPKRGEWKRRIVDSGFNADWVCSECGYRVKTDFVNYNFCPNCGADMKGADDEKGY